MTADLRDCPGHAIVVGADGVTIDLKGFTVDGKRSVGQLGIWASDFDGVTVKNGVVRDFYAGVMLRGDRASISGMTVTGSEDAGVSVDGDGAKIESTRASGNAEGFFVFGDAATIRSSSASGNGVYGIAVSGDGATIQSSTASGNGGYGIGVFGEAALVKGNEADGNGFDSPLGDNFGIDVNFLTTAPRGGKNVARGNDDPGECDPEWLCAR
jgi:hypothetical protein